MNVLTLCIEKIAQANGKILVLTVAIYCAMRARLFPITLDLFTPALITCSSHPPTLLYRYRRLHSLARGRRSAICTRRNLILWITRLRLAVQVAARVIFKAVHGRGINGVVTVAHISFSLRSGSTQPSQYVQFLLQVWHRILWESFEPTAQPNCPR